MKKFAIAVIALAILSVGFAMADDPIPATVETQGISTTTTVVCLGTVTNSESAVMTTSNMDLRNNPPLAEYTQMYEDVDGVLIPVPDNYIWTPERQYVMSYTEQILADNGYTEFNGVQSVDTANKVANQNTFASTEQFDYIASDTAMGRITFSEDLLLDGASQGSDATQRMLCPFATGDEGFIPACCNVVEMGGSFTGTAVSAVTGANERHISKAADIPVTVNYNIALTGQGSAAAWINAHLMEGRTGTPWLVDVNPAGTFWGGVWNDDMEMNGFMQGLDLVYKEKTTASGTISAFSKVMSYQSGLRRF